MDEDKTMWELFLRGLAKGVGEAAGIAFFALMVGIGLAVMGVFQ